MLPGHDTQARLCTHMSVFAGPVLDDWPRELGVGEPGRRGQEGVGQRLGGVELGWELESAQQAVTLPSSQGVAGERGPGAQEGGCAVVTPLHSEPLGGDAGAARGWGTSPAGEEPCTRPLWISLWAPRSRSWLRVSRRLPGFLLLPERQMFSRNKRALQASCGISRPWSLEEQYHVRAKSVHFQINIFREKRILPCANSQIP